ncbi:MAG: hypothetical protein JJ879_12295 [Sneathiella sp.]|nr:hypothetical protein [Sneathiella sp.]
MNKIGQLYPLLKAGSLGALTGIVFAIVFIGIPEAILLFVVGSFQLPWDLSWLPGVETILLTGAIGGGGLAIILYIKDLYVPYVEEVQDFEEDQSRDVRRQ